MTRCQVLTFAAVGMTIAASIAAGVIAWALIDAIRRADR